MSITGPEPENHDGEELSKGPKSPTFSSRVSFSALAQYVKNNTG